ncbi:MAG: FecR family protein [Pseudobacter sp.]|uniref:FecR family protein n=1 Tax=Pseudobacter sp. TaxID=2045420 RepID=UPI003F7E1AFD
MKTAQRFSELVEKFLEGNCTPQEKTIMELWFEKGGDITKNDLWLSETDRMHLLEKIHASQDSRKPLRSNKLRILFSGWRAAAVWMAVLSTAGLAAWKTGIFRPHFSNNETQLAYQILQTGKGEVKHYRLPDNSEITLNANSKLEYHPDFATHRQIRLHGEALFIVTHDKKHPFTVNTNDSLATTVLGTRFNIQSYDKNQETRITVVSGVVAVNRLNQTLDTLTRSEAIRYKKDTRSFTISHDVHTESVTGWTRGEWDYENLRFSDLAILLQNHYGITVTSRKNTALLQTGVSVNFNKRQTAKDILGVFCSFAGCSFRETNTTTIEIQ